jgi:hypothetical protein
MAKGLGAYRTGAPAATDTYSMKGMLTLPE